MQNRGAVGKGGAEKKRKKRQGEATKKQRRNERKSARQRPLQHTRPRNGNASAPPISRSTARSETCNCQGGSARQSQCPARGRSATQRPLQRKRPCNARASATEAPLHHQSRPAPPAAKHATVEAGARVNSNVLRAAAPQTQPDHKSQPPAQSQSAIVTKGRAHTPPPTHPPTKQPRRSAQTHGHAQARADTRRRKQTRADAHWHALTRTLR